uniref:Uncharacterized protein n=1 Tax=Oryza glumipatula TaxID=40148 RepID=A0A0D9ZKP6_9ORYZ
MGRVGADGLLPRFIWAAPLVGVVGETARGRRHDGTSGRRAAAAAAILDGAAAGDLSLSLPVGLRMVAKMTTQQDGVDTLTWALEKNNGYSSRFPYALTLRGVNYSKGMVLWGRSISAAGRCRCPVLYGQAGAPSSKPNGSLLSSQIVNGPQIAYTSQ